MGMKREKGKCHRQGLITGTVDGASFTACRHARTPESFVLSPRSFGEFSRGLKRDGTSVAHLHKVHMRCACNLLAQKLCKSLVQKGDFLTLLAQLLRRCPGFGGIEVISDQRFRGAVFGFPHTGQQINFDRF